MLYEMFGDLRDRMHARKFPTQFAYGPEHTAREGHHFSNLIVIERDREQSDEVEAAHGQVRNARKKFTRRLAAKATIFANCTSPGAHVGEHERVCEALVDALLVEIEDWGTESRAGQIPIKESRYLSAHERSDVETWPGLVYLVRFLVPRGVQRLDYTGAGLPTGAASSVTGRIDLRIKATDTPEVIPLP